MKKINLGYIHMSMWNPRKKLIDRIHELPEPNRKEIILPGKTLFTLKIDYPLSTPYYHEFLTPAKGYTRIDAVKKIIKCYREIYTTEDKTQTQIISSSTLLNRGSSNGKYGIWGHVLDDLILHTLIVNSGNRLEIGCDS